MTATRPQPCAVHGALDFQVAGHLTVRAIDATDDDAAVLRRQLGVCGVPSAGGAAIVVRFVDAVEIPPRARLAGPDMAFSPEHAFLLRGPGKARVRTRIALPDLQAQAEIVCERGAAAVPLLLAVINLVMAREGIVALHASAFVHDGVGVLVTGWAKGGKTETLLAFAGHGARYVADEWTYLSPGGWLTGVPEPVRLWNWQLRQLPEPHPPLGLGTELRLSATDGVARWLEGVNRHRRAGGTTTRMGAAVAAQANVRVPVRHLFGDRVQPGGCRLQRVVFVTSHAAETVEVTPMHPSEIAVRMVHSLQIERAPLQNVYRAYRFAYPQRANALIDGIERREFELLTDVLTGVESVELRHPFPLHIEDLYDALAPQLGASPC